MRPVVCIVGRANVGKSTLFNRLVGARQAIVEDQPGVTRDRLYGQADWTGRVFSVIDTGGLAPADTSDMAQGILAQARVGIEEADVLLFVVDSITGLVIEDREIGTLLRQSGKPVLLVANKADGPRTEQNATEFYGLGLGEPFAVSAQHGRAMPDLLDALVDALPPAEPEPDLRAEPEPGADGEIADVAPSEIKVALVGRPNAGKSSLVNRLLGTDRMLVDSKPGTTRDPVDSLFQVKNTTFRLIDTAGIRRRLGQALDMEKIAVLKAIRALDRTEIACLVLDATEGATEQDARVADLCRVAGCGLVLLLNKADLVKGGEAQWKKIEAGVRERLRFVDYAPMLRVSARSGRNVQRITETVLRIHGEWRKRLSTALLNRFLEEAVSRHHPSAFRGREVKLYYVTQPSARPPVFVFSTNRSEGVQEAFKRYLANQLREAFGFEGAPLRLFFRDRGKKKAD